MPILIRHMYTQNINTNFSAPTYGKLRVTSLLNLHVFGLLEEKKKPEHPEENNAVT